MAEKLYSYADKQVMDEVASSGGGSGGDSGGGSGGDSGGGYSPLFIHALGDVVQGSFVLDKTWKEVHDHIINGGTAFVVYPDIPGDSLGEVKMVITAGCYPDEDDSVDYVIGCQGTVFITTTENGYPTD